MTETQAHQDLKKLAHLILYKEGFDETEIQEEYFMRINDSSKSFRVDVVGISEKNKIMEKGRFDNFSHYKKVAVELGTTNPKKLAQLELFFDKVIHIPYGIEGMQDIELDQIIKFKNKNEELQKQINELNKIVSEKDKKISMFEKEVEYDRKSYEALRALRSVQSGLIVRNNLGSALNYAQESYCPSYSYSPDAEEKYKFIEKLFLVLFSIDSRDELNN